MKRCAFLSTDRLIGFVVDDEYAYPALQRLGWQVETVSWKSAVDWDRYAAVVIRSPWDYQDHPDAFLSVLEAIDVSNAALANPLPLVRWNLRKTYLRDLQNDGIPIVPTLWRDKLRPTEIDSFFAQLKTDRIVFKPVVSANADHTYPVRRQYGEKDVQKLLQVFRNRAFMVQPFVPAIVEEGEFSLIYFSGDHSHTILKTPKPDDFRVQEEHGGLIQSVRASAVLKQAGQRIIERLRPVPLYARADLVRLNDENFALMELELIEPALYFRMDADSPTRFARAFQTWMS